MTEVVRSITVPGEPTPYMRVARSRTGKGIVPRPMAKAKRDIGWEWRGAYPGIEPTTAAGIRVALTFYTRSFAKDWDNLAKLVTDALNHVAYKDDRQIDVAAVQVCRDENEPNPRTEITLRWREP